MTATASVASEIVAPERNTESRASGNPLIVPIAAVRRTNVAVVGGKGANLGEMAAVGLPVPPGFVLTIDAYRHFYDDNELGPRVAAELARIDADDPAALDRSARACSSSFSTVSSRGRCATRLMPRTRRWPLARRRRRARRRSLVRDRRGHGRSSRSPGMFESYLNVSGIDALITNIKACWASTFGARVLFYRIKQGMPAEMPVAVVVQRMVDSEKSGVMFTADPATRDASRIVIEAAWGLGEAIVQGAVTPDRHVLDKATLHPLVSEIAEKEFLLTWDEATHATERVDLAGDPRAKRPVLTADELTTLGALARARKSTTACRRTWSSRSTSETIYLTQSRPITTLGGRPTQP